jgi:hypothetical protein
MPKFNLSPIDESGIPGRAQKRRFGNASEHKGLLVRVGKGRGFVVEEALRSKRRFVITAAHCLPTIQPAWLGSPRLYKNLLGQIAKKKKTVSAACLFVDPVSDIAVLGSPDENFHEEANAYRELVDSVSPLKIGDAVAWGTRVPASLISLDGRKIECDAQHFGDRWIIDLLRKNIEDGMSGSPVLDEAGAAIGLVARDVGEAGVSPRLLAHLSGRFLVILGAAKAVSAEQRFAREYLRDRQDEGLPSVFV